MVGNIKLLIIIFLIFPSVFLVSQDKGLIIIDKGEKTILKSDRKTDPVFEKVLPGAEIFVETYAEKDHLSPKFGVIISLNNKRYHACNINKLINKLDSKENFTVEELIKAYIYLTSADIEIYNENGITLNTDKIFVNEEINYSSIDSVSYNYKATFDFDSKKKKVLLFFIEDMEIIREEQMFPSGKTGYKTRL